MPDHPSKEMSGRRTLLTFAAAHIFDDIYMNTLPPFVPLLVTSYGFSFAAAGLLVTFFTLTSSVSQPFFGYLTDRLRLRWLGALGLIWAGCFMGLLGLVSSYPLLLAVAVLAGVGPAIFHPHAFSVVSNISTSMKGRIMSVFLIGGNLGFAIGPVIVGLLTSQLGIGGMTLIALPGICMGVYLWRNAPDFSSREHERSPLPGFREFSPAAILLVVSVLRSWLYFSALSFIPSYFVLQGNSVLRSNSYVSLMLLAGVAGQLVGGSLSDTYGRKKVTMGSLLVSTPLLFLFLHSSGPLAMALLFLFGFTVMSSFSVTIVMIQEIMSRHVGIASGLMIGSAVGLGGLGVLVTGLIADAFSLSAALHSLIILPAAAGILTPLIPYRQHEPQNSP